MTLTAEMTHLRRESRYMLTSGTSVASEAPLDIHVRAVDSGGAPEWHPDFERWLIDVGVCFCAPPTRDDPRPHRYPCVFVEAKLRPPTNHAHKRRLMRAFRQLRDIDPTAYDIVWLLVGRHMKWPDVMAKINDSRLTRGQEPFEEYEMSVFAISGMSLLSTAF
jgi:hypothetical protein